MPQQLAWWVFGLGLSAIAGAAVAGDAQAAHTPATAPTTSKAPARDTQDYTEFIKLWSSNRNEECARFFLNDEDKQSSSTLVQAMARFGERRERYLISAAEEWEHERTIVNRTSYWLLLPMPEVRNERSILITREKFSLRSAQNKIFVLDYECHDATAETLRQAHKDIEVLRATFDDVGRPKQQRLSAGVRLYVQLCQIAEYERMWTHLQKLLALDVRDGKKEFRVIQEATRRATEHVDPPAEWAEVIAGVLADER